MHPVWKGGGTVKLVILSSEYKPPSQELVDSVQVVIDPEENPGQGIGLAPIDHTVTVVGAAGQAVDIGLHLTYASGYNWNSVQDGVTAAVENYFALLRQEWENETVVVRISQIETRLLEVAGVVDLRDTTLDSLAQNLQIDADAVPVLGRVTDG